MKNDEEEFNKDNISYEKLVQMVFQLKKDNIDNKTELKKTQGELKQTKEEFTEKKGVICQNRKIRRQPKIYVLFDFNVPFKRYLKNLF